MWKKDEISQESENVRHFFWFSRFLPYGLRTHFFPFFIRSLSWVLPNFNFSWKNIPTVNATTRRCYDRKMFHFSRPQSHMEQSDVCTLSNNSKTMNFHRRIIDFPQAKIRQMTTTILFRYMKEFCIKNSNRIRNTTRVLHTKEGESDWKGVTIGWMKSSPGEEKFYSLDIVS